LRARAPSPRQGQCISVEAAGSPYSAPRAQGYRRHLRNPLPKRSEFWVGRPSPDLVSVPASASRRDHDATASTRRRRPSLPRHARQHHDDFPPAGSLSGSATPHTRPGTPPWPHRASARDRSSCGRSVGTTRPRTTTRPLAERYAPRHARRRTHRKSVSDHEPDGREIEALRRTSIGTGGHRRPVGASVHLDQRGQRQATDSGRHHAISTSERTAASRHHLDTVPRL
jgi:hypothetical protein